MKHKTVVTLGILVIVFLVSVFFGLYQWGGGRYYLEMADLVNQKTGEEKAKLKKIF